MTSTCPQDGGGGEKGEISVLKDMLDFKETAAREVLFHPVMKTYLDLKWRTVKRYFFFNFACYVIFLLTYSLFLGNILRMLKRTWPCRPEVVQLRLQK